METFKLGEVVIGQGHLIDIALNGMEGVVAGPLRHHLADNHGRMERVYGHHIQWATGEQTVTEPHLLRKRRPPESHAGEQAIRELFNRKPITAPEQVES